MIKEVFILLDEKIIQTLFLLLINFYLFSQNIFLVLGTDLVLNNCYQIYIFS